MKKRLEPKGSKVNKRVCRNLAWQIYKKKQEIFLACVEKSLLYNSDSCNKDKLN